MYCTKTGNGISNYIINIGMFPWDSIIFGQSQNKTRQHTNKRSASLCHRMAETL